MSLKTLPLLFINLGGEMMYILDQRLRAQNIPQEKAKKVVHDIVGTMFNKRFMEELFKPQELYSKKAMRTVFDRLAHASIMRLNAASMDKLYDLMTMAFKYQVSLSLQPKDILLVTLNHMDAIHSFVEDNPPTKQLVDNVYRLVLQNYGALSHGEFLLVRQTLLNFFQDMHIRVSIFLKDKVQNSNGRFAIPTFGPVPWSSEVPGTIRIFNNGEQVKTTNFRCNTKYINVPKEPSFDMRGDRVSKLGTNMYSVARPLEATVISAYKGSTSTIGSDLDSHNPNPNSKAQLDLLSHLIGGGGGKGQKKGGKAEFRVNLFNTDAEEEEAAATRPTLVEDPGSKVIKIDASKKKRSDELNRIMGELTVDDNGQDEDDLLDLMDKA
ncbi:protein OSCP1-like [Lineus longissimus]|uniref:protein OSCP1-like n=1 Tax=Lineus longissimus TaxID=88925 RepID=UPI002B4C7625